MRDAHLSRSEQERRPRICREAPEQRPLRTPGEAPEPLSRSERAAARVSSHDVRAAGAGVVTRTSTKPVPDHHTEEAGAGGTPATTRVARSRALHRTTCCLVVRCRAPRVGFLAGGAGVPPAPADRACAAAPSLPRRAASAEQQSGASDRAPTENPEARRQPEGDRREPRAQSPPEPDRPHPSPNASVAPTGMPMA